MDVSEIIAALDRKDLSLAQIKEIFLYYDPFGRYFLYTGKIERLLDIGEKRPDLIPTIMEKIVPLILKDGQIHESFNAIIYYMNYMREGARGLLFVILTAFLEQWLKLEDGSRFAYRWDFLKNSRRVASETLFNFVPALMMVAACNDQLTKKAEDALKAMLKILRSMFIRKSSDNDAVELVRGVQVLSSIDDGFYKGGIIKSLVWASCLLYAALRHQELMDEQEFLSLKNDAQIRAAMFNLAKLEKLPSIITAFNPSEVERATIAKRLLPIINNPTDPSSQPVLPAAYKTLSIILQRVDPKSFSDILSRLNIDHLFIINNPSDPALQSALLAACNALSIILQRADQSLFLSDVWESTVKILLDVISQQPSEPSIYKTFALLLIRLSQNQNNQSSLLIAVRASLSNIYAIQNGYQLLMSGFFETIKSGFLPAQMVYSGLVKLLTLLIQESLLMTGTLELRAAFDALIDGGYYAMLANVLASFSTDKYIDKRDYICKMFTGDNAISFNVLAQIVMYAAKSQQELVLPIFDFIIGLEMLADNEYFVRAAVLMDIALHQPESIAYICKQFSSQGTTMDGQREVVKKALHIAAPKLNNQEGGHPIYFVLAGMLAHNAYYAASDFDYFLSLLDEVTPADFSNYNDTLFDYGSTLLDCLIFMIEKESDKEIKNSLQYALESIVRHLVRRALEQQDHTDYVVLAQELLKLSHTIVPNLANLPSSVVNIALAALLAYTAERNVKSVSSIFVIISAYIDYVVLAHELIRLSCDAPYNQDLPPSSAANVALASLLTYVATHNVDSLPHIFTAINDQPFYCHVLEQGLLQELIQVDPSDRALASSIYTVLGNLLVYGYKGHIESINSFFASFGSVLQQLGNYDGCSKIAGHLVRISKQHVDDSTSYERTYFTLAVSLRYLFSQEYFDSKLRDAVFTRLDEEQVNFAELAKALATLWVSRSEFRQEVHEVLASLIVQASATHHSSNYTMLHVLRQLDPSILVGALREMFRLYPAEDTIRLVLRQALKFDEHLERIAHALSQVIDENSRLEPKILQALDGVKSKNSKEVKESITELKYKTCESSSLNIFERK